LRDYKVLAKYFLEMLLNSKKMNRKIAVQEIVPRYYDEKKKQIKVRKEIKFRCKRGEEILKLNL